MKLKENILHKSKIFQSLVYTAEPIDKLSSRMKF